MSRLFLLGLLGVVLAATIGYELLATDPGIPAPTIAASAAPAPAPSRIIPLAGGNATAWANTILARPLFSLTRRPDEEKEAPKPAGTDQPAELPRLSGIELYGGNKHALFQPTGDVPPLVVAEGEELGSGSGWRVEKINFTSVVVNGPGGEMTLETKLDENAVPPPPVLPVSLPRPGGNGRANNPPLNQPLPRAGPPAPTPGQPQRPALGQPTATPLRPTIPRAVPPVIGPQSPTGAR
jgi:hypothetical protein